MNYASLLILLCIAFGNTAWGQTGIRNDTVMTTPNTSIVIDVRANDAPQQVYIYTTDYSLCCGQYSVSYGPQNGTITVLNWDSIEYTPNAGFTGTDRFYYGISAQQSHNSVADTAVVFVNVSNSTDIDEELGKGNFVVYPNPVNSKVLCLRADNLETSSYKISIYDFSGKVIETTSPIIRMNETISIDVTELKGGIYFIELISEGKHYSQKFIIE